MIVTKTVTNARRRGASLLLASAAVLLAISPAAASGPAVHDEFSIAGEVLPCPNATYTVVSGMIRSTYHETEAESGNTSFTGTITPRQVVLEDSSGQRYAMRGAIWFGGATNDRTGAEIVTATHNLEIVGRGEGVVNSIRLVERLRDGEFVERDFGTCQLP